MTAPNPSPEPMPQRVGPYRVIGHLGQGGMGEVLQGHDDRLDRPVALKRLHRTDEDARRRFRREAQAVAKLRHPCIVQVYDWVESEDVDWLVMELLDGLSLQEALEYSHPSLPQILHVARQIAAGLAEAHGAGLIHRDLKASNVMVNDTLERVWILDFGIAKSFQAQDGLSTLTGDGGIVGTVHNMSPEQALGQPLDPRSDLFSLGVLLYEMIGGENPFTGQNAVETLSRICSWQQPSLASLDPSVPKEISHLVDQLLKKDRKHRPASARDVVAALESFGNEEVQVAPRPEEATTVPTESTLFDLAQPKMPRHPLRKLSLAALAMLTVVGVGAWRLSTGPTELIVEPSPAALPSSKEDFTPAELTQLGLQRLERYDRDGNIASAIDDFQKALSADPEFAPALAGLAKGYWLDYMNVNREPSRIEQASAVAERAVELDPFLVNGWISRAMIRLDRQELELAQQDLERAVEMEPLNADAWFGLAKVAEKHSDTELATQLYTKAIDLRPASWIYPAALGRFFFRLGHYEQAESAFQQSLERAEGNYLSHRNLGTTYYRQGRLDEAATQLQLALQIRPDTSVYTNLGNIYFSQGRYVDAAMAFEKSLDIGVANAVQWANLGDAYRQIPDAEAKARQAYRQAIRLLHQRIAEPLRDPTHGSRLTLYEAKSGNCDAVPKGLSSLEELAQADASAWYRLATASEICRRREDAINALERAILAGYPTSEVRLDPELLQLRQDARFHRMMMATEAAKSG